jgi:hypothetical protein
MSHIKIPARNYLAGTVNAFPSAFDGDVHVSIVGGDHDGIDLTPTEAREYAARLLAAADKVEAATR